ncbi:hypothetical protein A2U01_0106505, partial [Trifolium medium]|nr:hypothetical protein [Trifolium medium]
VFCTTQQVLARCAAQDNSVSGLRALRSFGRALRSTSGPRALRRVQQTCSPKVDFLLTF